MKKQRRLHYQKGKFGITHSNPEIDKRSTYTIIQINDDVFVVKTEGDNGRGEVESLIARISYNHYINQMQCIQKLNHIFSEHTEEKEPITPIQSNNQVTTLQEVNWECASEKFEFPPRSTYCQFGFLPNQNINHSSCNSGNTEKSPIPNRIEEFLFAPAPFAEVCTLAAVSNEFTVMVDTSFAEKKNTSTKQNARLVATVQYNLDDVSL
ncbi:MAG TPA: hypothetical protein VFV52_02520 [Bacilli bacterium]|nr:hypothetical protein [Bacilli bacterium]